MDFEWGNASGLRIEDNAAHVKLTDGTDTADVVTIVDVDTDVDGLNGVVTAATHFSQIDDDTIKPTRMDASTHTLQTITYDHHEIHGGVSYQVSISDSNINVTPLRIKMVVPAQAARIHALVYGVSSGDSTFTITENPTGGASGGTTLTAINKRRDSANTSSTTLTGGVTAPTGGTVLTTETHGFDKHKISGETRGTAEWVFGKTGTSETYVFELESATADVVGNLLVTWYEHADKD